MLFFSNQAHVQGKKSKLAYFIEALDSSKSPLFRQKDSNVFKKVLLDLDKFETAIGNFGGEAVFGNWDAWGDLIGQRESQEARDGHAYSQYEAYLSNCLRNQDRNYVEQMAQVTKITLQEEADVDNLQQYASEGTDRRQAQLQEYLRRWSLAMAAQASVPGSGASKHIDVEHYNTATYHRLLAKACAGQKLTREARRAGYSSFCAEVDAPTCHPRLLMELVMKNQLDEKIDVQMLPLLCQYYKEWRSAIAEYFDTDIASAKVEIIKIFFGSKPEYDMPFLRKLATEVQAIARELLQLPEFAHYQNFYSDRRNPEFSRLSALISEQENKLLNTFLDICASVDLRPNVLLFDWCLLKIKTMQDTCK